MQMLVPRQYDEVRPHHLVVWYLGAAHFGGPLRRLCRQASDAAVTTLSSWIEPIGLPLIRYGVVPDFVIRWGIRFQLRAHLVQLGSDSAEVELENKLRIVEQLKTMPIAVKTQEANEQHYEVPAQFYDLCLGPCKKYSSGLWLTPDTTFEQSELDMLELYCKRSQIQDGMSVVDLGCGWGSLTLYLLQKYPKCKITSISNSRSQREYIMRTARERNLNVNNVTVLTVRLGHTVLFFCSSYGRNTKSRLISLLSLFPLPPTRGCPFHTWLCLCSVTSPTIPTTYSSKSRTTTLL